MKILYIADDGTTFEDEFECSDYEWKVNHPYLKEIIFYDKDNKIIIQENIFNEESYSNTEKVIIKSNKAISDLQDFANYTGFCDYKNIKYPGCWVWTNDYGFECQEKY